MVVRQISEILGIIVACREGAASLSKLLSRLVSSPPQKEDNVSLLICVRKTLKWRALAFAPGYFMVTECRWADCKLPTPLVQNSSDAVWRSLQTSRRSSKAAWHSQPAAGGYRCSENGLIKNRDMQLGKRNSLPSWHSVMANGLPISFHQSRPTFPPL